MMNIPMMLWIFSVLLRIGDFYRHFFSLIWISIVNYWNEWLLVILCNRWYLFLMFSVNPIWIYICHHYPGLWYFSDADYTLAYIYYRPFYKTEQLRHRQTFRHITDQTYLITTRFNVTNCEKCFVKSLF